jgi:hypothetical protein
MAENNQESVNICYGKKFKCDIACYLDKSGSYVEKVKMTPVKKNVCPGCAICNSVLPLLNDSLQDKNHPMIVNPIHKGLYTLSVVETTGLSRRLEFVLAP